MSLRLSVNCDSHMLLLPSYLEGKQSVDSLQSTKSPNNKLLLEIIGPNRNKCYQCGHVNFWLPLSALVMSIGSVTSSQLPLTESSVTVSHY